MKARQRRSLDGQIMKKPVSSVVTAVASATFLMAAEPEPGFVSLCDGKTLEGWKSHEAPKSFSVEDVAIRASGKRCHLFYPGAVKGAMFRNFELRLGVMTC